MMHFIWLGNRDRTLLRRTTSTNTHQRKTNTGLHSSVYDIRDQTLSFSRGNCLSSSSSLLKQHVFVFTSMLDVSGVHILPSAGETDLAMGLQPSRSSLTIQTSSWADAGVFHNIMNKDGSNGSLQRQNSRKKKIYWQRKNVFNLHFLLWFVISEPQSIKCTILWL